MAATTAVDPPSLVGRRPLETIQHQYGCSDLTLTGYQHIVHAKHNHERWRLINALDDSDDVDHHRIARKLDNCCRYANYRWDDDQGTIFICQERCRSRLCPLCGRARARQLAHALTERIKVMNSPRMLTLTPKSNSLPLRDQIQNLTSNFARLRRRRAWSKHFSGGFYVIEITFNRHTERWHPHLHAIVDGTYWNQAELAELWEVITGDSKIVDIRIVHQRSRMVHYLTSYLTKSSNVTNIPDDEIVNWSNGLRSLRMVSTFGDQHGLPASADDDEPRQMGDVLAHLEALACATSLGDVEAAELQSQAANIARRRIRPGDAPLSADVLAEHRGVADRLYSWTQWRQDPEQVGNVRLARPPPPAPAKPSTAPQLWHENRITACEAGH